MTFLSRITDDGYGNNAASVLNVFEDQATRYYSRRFSCYIFTIHIIYLQRTLSCLDQTSIGNRDDALKKTYRGLVNLKHVSFFHNIF